MPRYFLLDWFESIFCRFEKVPFQMWVINFMMQKSKCFWLPSNYSLCCWLSKVQFIAPKGLNGSSKNYFRSWKNHFGVSYYHLELDAFSKAYQVTKSKKRNVLRNQIHEKKKPGFHLLSTKDIFFPKKKYAWWISEEGEGLEFFMSSFQWPDFKTLLVQI